MKEKVAETKIPKIGSTVYILSDNDGGCITKEFVGFVGSESFVLYGFHMMDLDEAEQFYEDYNVTWFTNLAKAKKALLKKTRELHNGGRWGIYYSGAGVWSVDNY